MLCLGLRSTGQLGQAGGELDRGVCCGRCVLCSICEALLLFERRDCLYIIHTLAAHTKIIYTHESLIFASSE